MDDKKEYYKIGIHCSNCGYRGSKDMEIGNERPGKVVCPRCECMADTNTHISRDEKRGY